MLQDSLENPAKAAAIRAYVAAWGIAQIWIDQHPKEWIEGYYVKDQGLTAADGQWLVATRVKRPYSYVVPAGLFPRDVELWDRTGTMVPKLADVPMGDTIPMNGVFDGPRGFTWYALEPATLYWAEALDKGDIKNKVPHRDRLMVLKARNEEAFLHGVHGEVYARYCARTGRFLPRFTGHAADAGQEG